jgi:hypothetical protein
MIFNDACGIIRPITLWAIKIYKKCEHLSNIPSGTLQAVSIFQR